MDQTGNTILIVSEGNLTRWGYVVPLASDPNVGRLIIVDLELGFGLVREFAEQFGDRGVAYPSLEDALDAENPDGGVVATAPGNRYAPTMALLASGAHVLLETGGTTLSEWGHLAEVAADRGLRIAPTLHQLVAARAALALIYSGGIGVAQEVAYMCRRRVEGAEAERLRSALDGGRLLPTEPLPYENVAPRAIAIAAAIFDWPQFEFAKTTSKITRFGGLTYVNTLDVVRADGRPGLSATLVLATDLPERHAVSASVRAERGMLALPLHGGRPVLTRWEGGPPGYPLAEIESAERSRSRLIEAWVESLDLAPDAPSNLPADTKQYTRVQNAHAAARESATHGGEWIPVPR
jgi:hypothetical protein